MLERLTLALASTLGPFLSRIRIMYKRLTLALASTLAPFLIGSGWCLNSLPWHWRQLRGYFPGFGWCSNALPWPWRRPWRRSWVGSGWCINALPWPWRRPWRRSWEGSGWCLSGWRAPPDGAASPRAQSPHQGSPATRREIIKLKLDQRWANRQIVCLKHQRIFRIRRLKAMWPYPVSRIKKAPDPGSGSVTLHYKEFIAENHLYYTVPCYSIHFIFNKNQNHQLQLHHDDRLSSVPRLL